jgi:hypothetical protein
MDAMTWPALDLGGQELPSRLTCERGVWGKVHGAATDFRWIAATANFEAQRTGLERELALGAADVVDRPATLWRTVGDTSYAVAFYPSLARDASGRTGFLERQVLEWKRPPGVPAAAAALLLLPAVASLEATDWSEKRPQIVWSQDEDVMDLDAAAPLPVSTSAIQEAIERGVAMLAEATTLDALTELYASLLAGGRAVTLKGLSAPLSPQAMAALLLPLPRDVADRISIAGWLPSSWLSPSGVDELRHCWDFVLGGATAIPVDDSAQPTADHRQQAQVMARSLLTRKSAASQAARPTDKPLQLSLWGPIASGKTAFLAQLFIQANRLCESESPSWEIFPTERSKAFIRGMWNRMQTTNRFPIASTVGHVEGIEYIFQHSTGTTLSLRLEDRAGQDSIDLSDGKDDTFGLKERLSSADGLVLLFDPIADEALLDERVLNALMEVNIASGRVGRKDERPIAVCVSKADLMVGTVEDFEQAFTRGSEFVRERLPKTLLHTIERFCENYQLFPISAVGVRAQYGLIEPAVFFDETLEPRVCGGGMPFNLMEPFTWLLHELTGIS